MKDPKQFERVLELSFMAMFFIYTGMALFGYLQFGQGTKVLITGNLVHSASSRGELIISKILISFVIASCYFELFFLQWFGVSSVKFDPFGVHEYSKINKK